MSRLRDPLVEACATARLIEARAHAIARFAQAISVTPDTDTVKPEEWQSFSNSFDTLLEELKREIETFSFKAEHGT
jgi:hypothetical protein